MRIKSAYLGHILKVEYLIVAAATTTDFVGRLIKFAELINYNLGPSQRSNFTCAELNCTLGRPN